MEYDFFQDLTLKLNIIFNIKSIFSIIIYNFNDLFDKMFIILDKG